MVAQFSRDRRRRGAVGDDDAEEIGAEQSLDQRLVVDGCANDVSDRADEAGELALLGERPRERR